MLRRFGPVCVALLLPVSVAHAADGCRLINFAELPVTMEGTRPIVVANINGVEARFIADSGAFYSMLTPAAVAQFKLPTRYAPTGYYIQGVGGATTPQLATVQTFSLATYPIHNVFFLVGGNALDSGAVGLFGENLMRVGDVEFDFANGVMRFFKAENCKGPLAYWAKSQQVGMVDIQTPTANAPVPSGFAFVNGVKVRVKFDTGAYTSVLSLAAAKNAGITPDSPDVKAVGTITGIGHGVVRAWIAPLSSFKIGGEEIQHTKLIVSDSLLPDTDMLIGADFFLSHRVFVANDQKKVYFTYNGGPVFDIEGSQHAPSSAPSSAPPADDPGSFSDQPSDAAGFMRRGMAYAARRDFGHALSDLKRACELAPSEPDYYYELGRIQWQSGHPDQALEAFNKALELKPGQVNALFARARLRLERHEDASQDLDAIDRVTAPEDDLRLGLAGIYGDNQQFASSIHQYDLWIAAHPNDVQLSVALNGRCWARAEANQDLDRALADCNAALRLQPQDQDIRDSRGLVRLRRGELDLAIADYDAVLAGAPKTPTSLYGRGLAKLLKGLKAEGQADLAAATALQPGIAARFAGFGLKP